MRLPGRLLAARRDERRARRRSPSGRIQEAIDIAPAGGTVHVLAGTYDEHATINKARLDLIGAGDTATPTCQIVDPSTDGPAIAIAESGTTPDPLTVKTLRTTGAPGGGNTGSGLAILDAPGTTTSDISVDTVTSTANTGNGLAVNTSDALARLKLDDVKFNSNTGIGLRFPTSMAASTALTIDDSQFDSNAFGLAIFIATPTTPLTAPFTNVSITDSTFNNNSSKGIYAERLDDAVLDNLTVDSSGTTGTFAAGIDINLKKNASDDIEIKNSDITDSGTGDATNGYGLTIKARDDGTTNGPTTLTGVDVHHNTITGNQRGVRLGEPTKNNPGPTDVHFNKNDISGNLSGEGMTNVTTVSSVDAECNWWGSANGPGSPPPPERNTAGPNIDFSPWLVSNDLNGNCPPEANDDVGTTNEDTQLTVAAPGLLANDKDFENATLTAAEVTDPANGDVTVNSNGSYTYTPNANFNGTDTFTYKVNDGTHDSAPATVTITVNAVNDAPVAVDDTGTTNEDTPLTVVAPGVLGNDTDVENNTLTAAEVTDPANGDVTVNSDGSYTYTPNLNFNGTDTFTYKANDGQADSNTATVTITVNAVNDAPVAVNDSYSTHDDDDPGEEDSSLDRNATDGVLANDTDVDNDPEDLTAALVDDVDHGDLEFHDDGSFSYTPDAGYTGPDSFTYKANDGELDSSPATVSITVAAFNEKPAAIEDSYSTAEDTPLSVPAPGVLDNDTDADGPDPLTATNASDPANGTVTLASDGSFTYTPDANFEGTDSFTYTAFDGDKTSDPTTVTISVNAVDDPPTAVDDSSAVTEDSGATALAVRGNDDNADGGPLMVASASDPDHGTTALSGGDVTYAPDANYCGNDTFTYTLNGGDSATVSVTVACADDAPGAANDAATVAQGAPATPVDVLANDPDVDGGPKQVTGATQAPRGTTTATASGVTYRPDPLYCNSQPGGTPDTFTYTVNGGAQATVAMTVTCAGPQGEGEDTVRPVFASARLSPTTFAVNPRGTAETLVNSGTRRRRAPRGTTFTYRLSESARVLFTIEQRAVGRRVGRTCQRPTSRNRNRRACVRYVKIGSFAAAGDAGSNRKAFSGRIGRRSLRPGRYRATLVATDTAGNKSAAKRLNFRVVRR